MNRRAFLWSLFLGGLGLGATAHYLSRPRQGTSISETYGLDEGIMLEERYNIARHSALEISDSVGETALQGIWQEVLSENSRLIAGEAQIAALNRVVDDAIAYSLGPTLIIDAYQNTRRISKQGIDYLAFFAYDMQFNHSRRNLNLGLPPEPWDISGSIYGIVPSLPQRYFITRGEGLDDFWLPSSVAAGPVPAGLRTARNRTYDREGRPSDEDVGIGPFYVSPGLRRNQGLDLLQDGELRPDLLFDEKGIEVALLDTRHIIGRYLILDSVSDLTFYEYPQ